MEDGELHMGYHEEMLNFVLEFGCMPPLDIRVPDDFGGEEWESRWGQFVAGGAAVPTSETREAWMYHVMELHERFEAYERSTEASAARTAAHDDVKVVFAALARNAGAIAVAMEPRGWDAGGATDRHKRPDIEWINVETRLFTVSDVAIRWAMTAGSGTEHAAAAEKNKVTDYEPAMKRNREAAARARRPADEFVPLGFAKNGAWGPETQRVFATLAKMAEQCKRVSADLYGWSAMTWKAHWPVRLGVTLARARAALVTEGVRCRQQVAGDGQRDPEAEEKRVSMQYRA